MTNTSPVLAFLASEAAIKEWLVAHLADLLKIHPQQVVTDLDFDNFGLDSRDLVGMVGQLSEQLQLEIDDSMVYDHPTIDELSEAIASQMKGASQ